MSALPPKADIQRVVAECLLLTQSGHRVEWINGAEIRQCPWTIAIAQLVRRRKKEAQGCPHAI